MIRFLETLNNSFTFKENLEKSDLISSENEYIVPGRELEYRKLNKFIKYNSNKGNALYICGQPGTGKSLTLMTLSKTLSRDIYKTVYINCYTCETRKIYSEIYRSIKNLVSTKKNENESLQLIKNLLPTFPRTIVLILDEVDIIVKNPTMLNTIFEWPFLADSKLLLFGIANDLNLVENSLPGLSKKGIEVPVLQFKPYNEAQILSILNGRLNDAYDKLDLTEAQRSRVFEDEALELISKQISQNNSDIRKAFEVMRSLSTKKYESYIDTLNDDQLDESPNALIPIPDGFIDDNSSNSQDQYIFTIDSVMDVMSSMFESQIVKKIKYMPAHSQVILFSAFLKELNFLTLYESYKSNCQILNFNVLEKKDFSLSLDCCTSNSLMTMIESKNETKRVITIHYSKEDLVRAFKNSIMYAGLVADLIPKESDSESEE